MAGREPGRQGSGPVLPGRWPRRNVRPYVAAAGGPLRRSRLGIPAGQAGVWTYVLYHRYDGHYGLITPAQ